MSKTIKTVIIGKNSNLTLHLNNYIKDTFVLGTIDVVESFKKILNVVKKDKINIIFNNFQAANYLNDLSNPSNYIFRSIQSTSDVLTFISEHNIQINKIIYTSSSSVYGNNIYSKESDPLLPLNIHASLKVSNEKLIEKFSLDNKIDYIITRIYNMYGGYDNFSVISKIINAVLENNTLTIVNNGNAIRDFIHINDVVKIYSILLDSPKSGVFNIGTGNGNSIKGILEFLAANKIYLKIMNLNRDELKISTSNNEKLLSLIGNYNFKLLNEYILNEIKVKRK